MENKMAYTELTNEQIAEFSNEILLLGEMSIRRMPKYDTEDGRRVLGVFQAEIAKRDLTPEKSKVILDDLVKTAIANVASREG
jgi:hypothetical protein